MTCCSFWVGLLDTGSGEVRTFYPLVRIASALLISAKS
jgi:hypothetical protein